MGICAVNNLNKDNREGEGFFNEHTKPIEPDKTQNGNSQNGIQPSTPTEGEGIQNNNINTPNSSATIKQPSENLENIIINCKNYFESKKDFIDRLNETSFTQGYLLDLLWVNNWKKNSNYEWIKTEYFDKGDEDIKSIKNDILSNHKHKEFKNLESNDIENYILDNDSKIKKMLETNNSFIIINHKFLKEFTTNSNIKSINLSFSPKQLKIQLYNGEFKLFKTEDIILNQEKCLNSITNISTINKSPKNNIPEIDNNYNFELLKHLFKNPFFKMNLNSPNNELCSAYIVNKDIISKIKGLYNLKDEILPIFDNEKLLEGITYQNFDDNYKKIINHIYENKIDFLNKIKKYEEPGGITFNETEFIIKEEIMVGKPNLKYYFNFEIIDKNFGDFLKKLYSNLMLFQVSYIKIENKIFLIINSKQKNIYEILSFIPDNYDLDFEYVIEIIQANNINDVCSIIRYIIPNLQNKAVFSPGMIIKGANNASLIFHQINQKDLGSPPNVNKTERNDNTNENDKFISRTGIGPGINQNMIFQGPINANTPIQTSSNTTIGRNILNQNNPKSSDLSKQFFLIDKNFFDIISPKLNLENNGIFTQINVPQNISQNGINYSIVNINHKQFYYPTNFNIIYKTMFSKINNIYKNQSVQNLVEEIYLIPVNGGFFFSFKNNMFVNINNLIYLFSKNEKSKKLCAIIECINNNDKFNRLSLINQNPFHKDVFQKPEILKTLPYSPLYLINDNPPINIANKQQIITNPSPKGFINDIITPQQALKPSNDGNLGIPPSNINISDRLKTFILFALAQEYKKVDTNFQKYYLINPEWLEHYQFQKIKNLVQNKLEKIVGLWNISYDLNSLSQIIPILDQEKLKKYDSKMMTNPQKDFLVPSEKISVYDKYIDIYGKFVLANENIFNLLKKYFQIKQESLLL